MRYKIKDSANLKLIAMKWKLEDYEKDGIQYLALGDIDTVLINKETREISHMGLSLGMVAIVDMWNNLGVVEEIEETYASPEIEELRSITNKFFDNYSTK